MCCGWKYELCYYISIKNIKEREVKQMNNLVYVNNYNLIMNNVTDVNSSNLIIDCRFTSVGFDNL